MSASSCGSFLLHRAGFASYGAPLQTLTIRVQRAGSDLPFYEAPTATSSTDDDDERLVRAQFDIYETTDAEDRQLDHIDGRYCLRDEQIRTVGDLLRQDTSKIAHLFHLRLNHWSHDNDKFSPPDAGIYPVKTHARITVYQPPRLDEGFVALVRNFTLLEGVEGADMTRAWDLLVQCLVATCPAGMKVRVPVERSAKEDVVRKVVQMLRRAGLKH